MVGELRHERSGRRTRLHLQVFGSLRLSCDDETRGPRDLGGTKPRQILEILVSARGHPVPKDRLIALLWGEDRPRDAPSVLESHVSVLRRHLTMCGVPGRDVVSTVPGGYQLVVGAVDLDLDRFDSLLQEARGQTIDGALRSLEEALSLVEGPVFEDELHASWAERMRARYDEVVERARLDAAEGALTHRRFDMALDVASVVAQATPSNERACRILMIASYASGEQEPALRAYLATRDALRESLGVEPLQETQSLYLAILRQDPIDGLLPEDLRRTEPGFRRLVEQQGATVWWTTNRDMRVTTVSGEAERLLGLRPSDLVGQTLPELFPEAESAVVGTHRRALGGESWTSDVEWNDRVLKVHVEPLRRGDEVGGVVSVALDVTDRNRATAVLNEMEQRLRTQYEGFPIPTYTWQRVGDDFLLVGFNEAAERASEGAARRYVGRKATEIYREEPEILRDITRSATEQTTIQREMRYSVPEIDRETFLRVTYVFVPPDQVVVHTEDQTRRRELEEELLVTEESLRTLVDRSSDAIFIIDPSQDVILDANARAGEMLGYEREQLLSIRPSDLHPEEMPQLLRFMEALETGRSGWTDDFTCTTRDGRLLRVEIAAARAPFRGHRAVINLIRPITPGREADPTLLEALSPAGGHG